MRQKQAKKTDPGNQRRDRAIAVQVFLDYRQFIRDVICRHAQDEDSADDLFQDFFISFTSYGLPKEIQDVESYLCQAITNAIVRDARQRQRYKTCIHEYAKCSDRTRYNQKTPEEVLVDADEANRIFELIEKNLPRTEAQVVTWQYRDGNSAAEIAETMNVAGATVRGYVSEGLKKIRRILRDIEARSAK